MIWPHHRSCAVCDSKVFTVLTVLLIVMFNIVIELASEPRPSSNILRLIYQGRFLHGNVTLAGIESHFVCCTDCAHAEMILVRDCLLMLFA